jgi:hypothetical protein
MYKKRLASIDRKELAAQRDAANLRQSKLYLEFYARQISEAKDQGHDEFDAATFRIKATGFLEVK